LTGAQTPSACAVFAFTQATQRPVHGALQQTPSVQAVAHCPFDVHAEPRARKSNSSALAKPMLSFPPPATSTLPFASTDAM
jgi:hypothetical protein